MPSLGTPESPQTQAQPEGKAGLHDAFWTHAMLSFMRWLPRWFCVWAAKPISFLIYLMAGAQRRAVCANLDALHPELGPCIIWRNGLRVFEQFAFTYLDRLWHLHFGQEVKWQLVGEDHFKRLRAEAGGALVFTVHAGNYDMGSALFAGELHRPLHIVRTPEQSASLHRLRSMELASQEQSQSNLHVHYNESGSHLGLELCKLLQSGELVAIQGDRVLMDVSPISIKHGAVAFKLPLGPLVLAEMTRVPCYPVFLTRSDVMSYRVDIGPAFCARGEKLTQTELATRWLNVMTAFLAEHWDQWFVFEHLVFRDPP